MNTPRLTILAASAVLGLGAISMGSAFANSSHDPDPYTYATQVLGARADAGSVDTTPAPSQVQVGVYNSHGSLIGFEWAPNR